VSGRIQFMALNMLAKVFVDYRINWLRSKARFDRYSEELHIVKAEMSWMLLYLETQQTTWKDRALASTGVERLGHKAYGFKQADMWKRIGIEARKAFTGLM
jgi:hypothetical protein